MLIASQYGMRSGQVQNRGGVGIAQSQSPQTQFTTDVSDTSRFQSLSFSRLDTAASGSSESDATGSASAGSAQTATAGSATRTSGGVKLGTIIDILV